MLYPDGGLSGGSIEKSEELIVFWAADISGTKEDPRSAAPELNNALRERLLGKSLFELIIFLMHLGAIDEENVNLFWIS